MNPLLAPFALLIVACMIAACKPSPLTQTGAEDGSALTSRYQEPHRPQFHFSPQEKWMNDPNGMFFYAGEYHLFYQYYPDSTVWGPMHWGHAVSRDMVRWEHLPIALYPDSLGYIFSGSAVVDWNNSSGLGINGEPPLVAIFTYHNAEMERAGRNDHQTQGIAYSHDKGRTWTKYVKNPVLPNPESIRDFRDPKVIWDETRKQWVMVLAAGDHVKFWASQDLKNWAHLSDFGKTWGVHAGVWECPDLFPLQVAATGESKWVMLLSINPGAPNGGSGTQYFVGNFDGKTFTLDPSFAPAVANEKGVWIDYGRDNYAGVTWSDIPREDGRRLFIGWMSNWHYANVVPTEAWRSAMTLPRTLSLEKTGEGYRLFSQPVRELQALRSATQEIPATAITGELDLTQQLAFAPTQMELILNFELPAGSSPDVGVQLSNAKGESYRIGYNAATRQFYSDRRPAGNHAFSEKFATHTHTAPRVATGNQLRLHLFFDVASAELFADEGASCLTDIFFPSEPFSQVSIYADGGGVKVASGSAYALESIWR